VLAISHPPARVAAKMNKSQTAKCKFNICPQGHQKPSNYKYNNIKPQAEQQHRINQQCQQSTPAQSDPANAYLRFFSDTIFFVYFFTVQNESEKL